MVAQSDEDRARQCPLALSRSTDERERTEHYAVCKPFTFKMDAVLAKDRSIIAAHLPDFLDFTRTALALM
jgi:hypothetical protein